MSPFAAWTSALHSTRAQLTSLQLPWGTANKPVVTGVNVFQTTGFNTCRLRTYGTVSVAGSISMQVVGFPGGNPSAVNLVTGTVFDAKPHGQLLADAVWTSAGVNLATDPTGEGYMTSCSPCYTYTETYGFPFVNMMLDYAVDTNHACVMDIDCRDYSFIGVAVYTLTTVTTALIAATLT